MLMSFNHPIRKPLFKDHSQSDKDRSLAQSNIDLASIGVPRDLLHIELDIFEDYAKENLEYSISLKKWEQK